MTPPFRRTAVPPYRRTAVPPYRRTAVPPYRRTPLPPHRREPLPSDHVREPANSSRAVPGEAHIRPEVPVQEPPGSHRIDRIACAVRPDRLQLVPSVDQ